MDANEVFNTSGKFPSNADFWASALDDLVSEDGITKGFSRVIAEQVFRPVNDPLTPFYNRFAGRPVSAGYGWTERILGKTAARRFNPKASAQDALGFYDNSGLEFSFNIDYEGWRPVSLPSELASIEQFLTAEGVGRLNNLLVDNNLADYQRDMEAATELKAVTTTKSVKTLTSTQESDPQEILKIVQQTANEMRGNTVHYNELDTTQNDLIYTNSDRVLVFLGQQLYDDIMDSFASMPNPDRIVRNAELIPVVDGLPTPLTTAEYNDGVKDPTTSAQITAWNVQPVALDQPAPLIWMCAANRMEIRPLIGSYRVNLQTNAAGDFVNEHLLWKAAIAVKPWENAIRINGSE